MSDPSVDLVVTAAKALKERIASGDIVKGPIVQTGTVVGFQHDTVTITLDEPNPQPLLARTMIGWIRVGTRVQVQSDPSTGLNLVIGRVTPDEVVDPTDLDGWTPSILDDNDHQAPAQVARGVWSRQGQVADVWAFFVFGGAGPTAGTFRVQLPFSVTHPGSAPTASAPTALDTAQMVCGSGLAVQAARNPGDPSHRVGFIVRMHGDGRFVEMCAAAGAYGGGATGDGTSMTGPGFTVFDWNVPWGWGVGDNLSFHARVPIAPGT